MYDMSSREQFQRVTSTRDGESPSIMSSTSNLQQKGDAIRSGSPSRSLFGYRTNMNTTQSGFNVGSSGGCKSKSNMGMIEDFGGGSGIGIGIGSGSTSTFPSGLSSILSLTLKERCNRIENYLRLVYESQENLKEFYQFFPALLENLFGFDGKRGWINEAQNQQPDDKAAFIRLMSSKGPLFRLFVVHANDKNWSFAFPFARLPPPTQAILKSSSNFSTLPPLYSNIAKYLLIDRSSQIITLNIFEYFVFCFAYYAVSQPDLPQQSSPRQYENISARPSFSQRQAGTSDFLAKRNSSNPLLRGSVYLTLLLDYLNYFFPSDHHDLKEFSSSWGKSIRSQTPVSTKPSGTFFLDVAIEFWLNQNEAKITTDFSGFANSPFVVTDYVLPTTTSLKAIRLLIFFVLQERVSDTGTSTPSKIIQHPGKLKYPSYSKGFFASRSRIQASDPDSHLVERVENILGKDITVIRRHLFKFFSSAFTQWPVLKSPLEGALFSRIVTLMKVFLNPWAYQNFLALYSPTIFDTMKSIPQAQSNGLPFASSSSDDNTWHLSSPFSSLKRFEEMFSLDKTKQKGHSNQGPQKQGNQKFTPKWIPWVYYNYPFYTTLFGYFLSISFNFDFKGSSISVSLLAKIVDSLMEVKGFLKDIEMAHPNGMLSIQDGDISAAVVYSHSKDLQGSSLIKSLSSEDIVHNVRELIDDLKKQVHTVGSDAWSGQGSFERVLHAGTIGMSSSRQINLLISKLQRLFDLQGRTSHIPSTPTSSERMASYSDRNRSTFNRKGRSILSPDVINNSPLLSPEGRSQVSQGHRKCTNLDIQYIGNPALKPISTLEVTFLVRCLYRLSNFLEETPSFRNNIKPFLPFFLKSNDVLDLRFLGSYVTIAYTTLLCFFFYILFKIFF